jgi:hypothetical protein
MLACAGGRNQLLVSLHALHPEHPHACRWRGRAPIGPLGEHIATTANADRASSMCLEACIGANATTFLVFDRADVQARACMCGGFVRAYARFRLCLHAYTSKHVCMACARMSLRVWLRVATHAPLL